MIKWLFGIPPKLHSKWTWREGDPFNSWNATVLEIRSGWVKFQCTSIKGFQWESSLGIRSFRALYKELS